MCKWKGEEKGSASKIKSQYGPLWNIEITIFLNVLVTSHQYNPFMEHVPGNNFRNKIITTSSSYFEKTFNPKYQIK